MNYKTKGTCSQQINFEVEGSIIKSVEFIGGCHGNTQGVAALVRGMDINEAINRLEGINCRGRG
ncbi:MAG: TIGR03905 family TSCPD domain-containing protein, partial [Lachnospiraceae bacterium]|nr:TIGR03905 family TSCPD domain-containing protein [Lachnospiraceae bacterium]